MVISYKRLIKFLLGLILLIYMGYAPLLGIPILSDIGNARVVISILAMVIWLIIYQRRYLKLIRKYTVSFFNKYIFLLIAVLLIQAIYGAILYNQSAFDMYIVLIEYTFLLLVYPILIWLNENEEKFFKYLIWTTCIFLLIITIKAIFINHVGWTSALEYSFRNGRVRIATPAICAILTVVLFYRMINTQDKKIGSALLFVLFFFALFWVDQTRMSLVAICCGIGACILAQRKKRTVGTLLIYLVLSIFIIVVISSGALNTFLDSFALGSVESSSTSVRLGAIEYFLKFFRKNPILGMGYIRPINDKLISIWSGPLNNYYLNDLGAIGLLCRVGLTSIIIYWIPLIRMFIVSFRALKYKATEGGLLMGLAVYVAATSVSLIYTDQGRLLWFGLLIAVFEYYNTKILLRYDIKE